MAKTAVAAIDQLLRDSINLDQAVVKRARDSRDWLLRQISGWPEDGAEFPALYPQINLHYGSFTRRTKIKELDDIDLMIGLKGLGTTYTTEPDGTVKLKVPEEIALRRLCHDGTDELNSRRVINEFVARLKEIPQYQKAEIKRNEVAAVLSLSSYPWAFDIVPSFITATELDGRTYYVIPNGKGHWMKTDPRIDNERVESINARYAGHLWNVIRLTKFWNQRPSVKTVPPYLLECLVLDLYDQSSYQVTARPESEVARVLRQISHSILTDVADPKGIQQNINKLNWEDRTAVSAKASSHAASAAAALDAQARGEERAAINHWKDVFGTDLPAFG
ncbi:MAG TPA: hypothetical protein VF647_10065 [Longimicrobium sp.]|jgi:hypothetical protein